MAKKKMYIKRVKKVIGTSPFIKYTRLEKNAPSKPAIFNLSDKHNLKRLQKLLKSGEIRHIRDEYRVQLRELFAINNPPLVFGLSLADEFAKHYKTLVAERPEWQQGRWVFFPWLSTLVHTLDDKDFQQVRMARNKNLITQAEQDTFYASTIGIAGLSVGNSIALSIVLQGGARRIKIADHDALELSNTNRIRTTISALGLPKVEMTARQIYEINPYATVEIFANGLTTENIESFFSELDIIIDEIDNLSVKYLIREHAQKLQIPVVMAVDNGDNSILDVERYDLPNPPQPFHGRLGEVTYKQLQSLNKTATGGMIVRHIGPENLPPRVWYSFKEMGKTLASWPQLGGAALLNGAAVAYVVRKILNKQQVIDNRAILSFDQLLDPSSRSPETIQEQIRVVEEIKALTDSKKHG